MPVLGIDIGTQSLKAVILDDALEILGAGAVPYQPDFPRPGWAEQDSQLWLDALGPAIAQALAESRLRATDIAALAICGQLDGCVATGGDGRPLAPAIIWMDRRADRLLAAMDAGQCLDRCGLVLDATHMGGKIAWLHANLSTRSEVVTWHQPVSFVVAALTGRQVMSRSLGSTTMLYNVANAAWDPTLVEQFGATLAELPELQGEADVAGRLTAEGAALTGLPMGLPVAVGTGDDFSNLLGSGIGQPGSVGVSLGTAETVGALSVELRIDRDMLVETHAFPGGLYHLGNPGWLSGGAVRWAMSVLGIASDAAFSAEAQSAPPGCDGLVFIPALNGAMSPKWISAARGSFIGLTTSHGRGHMARAVLEGTAFAMRDVVERLEALNVPTHRLRLMGGGAQSALWSQMRADVAQRPADILADRDASAIGAALLAAVLAGLAPDIPTAVSTLRLPLRSLAPTATLASRYDDAYASYRDAFAALAPMWLAKEH